METAVVDFETEKIDRRPVYPPKPVGVAIRWPDKSKEYLAFGHPEGNNCDVALARAKLKDAFRAPRVLFHHAAFDMDVAECHLGLKPTGRVDDTLFLGFLKDPYTPDLGLKPLADRDLNMPADESDRLKNWILQNLRQPNGRAIPASKWGEYISEAPGRIVAPYAIGDVRRTALLFKKYMPEIEERGMRGAYERELSVMPISMEMERSGIRIDRKRLMKCRDVFEKMDMEVMRRICRRLHLNPKKMKSEDNPKGFNLNSGQQLGEALLAADKLDSVVKTPSGGVCTKIDVLRNTCNDKQLIQLLGVHSVAEKYLSSFIRPWLVQSVNGGRVLPKFNQTRGYDEGGGGARTGRFSSSDPNLQNVSANIEESRNRELLMYMQKLLKEEYSYPFIGLRDFMLPDEGCVMICVDYDQQELRILAHFEKGVLMRAYLDNPKLDVHEFVRQLIKKEIGMDFPRKFVKITVFGIVYGMGTEKLARQLGVEYDDAAKVKKGVLTAVPGIQRIMNELKRLASHDMPMRTWGGREYFAEEPRFKDGMMRSFEYKLFNYRIQGSAADATKEGMIQVAYQCPLVRIAVQVHDELVVMARDPKMGPEIARAMCDMKFRVPMTATAKVSTRSWARAA